ncbi:MAG: hypothetical protein FWD17_01480 [Polyangiaceae bacterium]|nr:hypothetical protein [Polyangiaceae bacterium]
MATGTSAAHADDRPVLAVDWQQLTEAFRAGGAVVAPESANSRRGGVWSMLRMGGDPRAFDGEPEHDDSGGAGDAGEGNGTGTDASIIARDWGGPRVALGHLSTIDRIRLSRSSRMLVGRLRVSAGRITPFAQLGLGQWRLDPDLVPARRSDIAQAAQFGYGFELGVSSRASVAFEADYTLLHRDEPCPSQPNLPELWGAFLAARGWF